MNGIMTISVDSALRKAKAMSTKRAIIHLACIIIKQRMVKYGRTSYPNRGALKCAVRMLVQWIEEDTVAYFD